ncbi:hypothetical protein DKX38_003764 [Salix brachista]|uniref:Uncharacterized protein n=1 Tax=Salix brachista TaxID=2182728 RepID=A0A5N5N8J5_9ROSI|nr:hypothetical protein DKX38_003764 [Salix brachista]
MATSESEELAGPFSLEEIFSEQEQAGMPGSELAKNGAAWLKIEAGKKNPRGFSTTVPKINKAEIDNAQSLQVWIGSAELSMWVRVFGISFLDDVVVMAVCLDRVSVIFGLFKFFLLVALWWSSSSLALQGSKAINFSSPAPKRQ